MTTNVRPPHLARAILRACAPPGDRPWLVDDLDELYAKRHARDGRIRANAWYRWQVARSTIPLLARRLQTSLPGHAPMPTNEPTRERLPALAYFLRHAFRRLTREPAFTIAAALTLAIGVGGNVAVFAVVEAVLLRPLPYPAADRLLILNHRDTRTGITKEFVPTADYAGYRGAQCLVRRDRRVLELRSDYLRRRRALSRANVRRGQRCADGPRLAPDTRPIDRAG